MGFYAGVGCRGLELAGRMLARWHSGWESTSDAPCGTPIHIPAPAIVFLTRTMIRCRLTRV